MSWQEGVAVTVVLIGLGAGAFLVAQRPSFWIEFGGRLGKAMLPVTSRKNVRLFLEQLRFEFVPVLHGLQWRLAAEG